MAVRLGSTVGLNKTHIYYYSKFRYKTEPSTFDYVVNVDVK